MSAPTLPAWSSVDGDQAPADDQVDTAWHAGYAEGHRAGLDARPHADVYVPVPTRWRYVAEGDTFVGGSSLWHVQARRDVRGAVAVTAVCGARTFNVADLDPDEAVTVLLSCSERDAVSIAADVLGARVTSRSGGPPP